MDRDQILAVLKEQKRALKAFGVRSLALFGSIARDQAGNGSDIDILVEFSRPVGLFEFARLKFYIEDLLGREVDLVTPEAIRKELREDILREAVRAT